MRNEELVCTLSIHSHFYRKTGLTKVNLSKGVFEQCRLTGSGLFSFMRGIFGQICGQIVSIMRQRLRNTNLVALIHFKKKKTTLPVEVRRSKTPCLSSLIKGVQPDGKLRRISPFQGAKRARTHERAVKPLAFSFTSARAWLTRYLQMESLLASSHGGNNVNSYIAFEDFSVNTLKRKLPVLFGS